MPGQRPPNRSYWRGGDSLVQASAGEKRMTPLSSLQNDRCPVWPCAIGTVTSKTTQAKPAKPVTRTQTETKAKPIVK